MPEDIAEGPESRTLGPTVRVDRGCAGRRSWLM